MPLESELSRLRSELAIDAAQIGTFDWDLVTDELIWDEQLIRLFGYDVASFERTFEAFDVRVHPDDRLRVGEAIRASIASCGDFEAEYRVVLPDGETRWVHARGRCVPGPDGAAVRMLGAAYDATGERGAESRVSRVLEAMPAGFYSLDRQWRFSHVNAEAERLLGRTRDELLGAVIWDTFPATVASAFEDNYRQAATTGRPLSFEAFYPEPLNGWYEIRVWPSPDGLSVYFLEVTERRAALQAAERTSAHLAVLARVSAELAGTLDGAAAVGRVARLLVPTLADWCIVTVLPDGSPPRDVGSWHADPAQRALLGEHAEARLGSLPATSELTRVLYSGEELALSGGELIGQFAPGPGRSMLELLAPQAALVLPLPGRERALGALTLVRDHGSDFLAADLTTARDVAGRMGLALDNARLYAQQVQLAEGLQRSLLTEPPEPDHMEIAVRYQPAVQAARVGGDWYDAFIQPGGTTMLVIGDVVGHDTAAAAAMGQLRSLLRGIATYSDAGPAAVLTGLDTAMAVLGLGTYATAAVARFEQDDDERTRGVTRMRWSSAGHLPPLAVHPDGTVTVLADWRSDLMLGVQPATTRTEAMVTLDRGTTVFFYTDGLIERRDADLDDGLGRLRDALTELAHVPLSQLCDAVLDRLVEGRPDDDVALVAVRLHRQDRPRPAEAGLNRVPAPIDADPAL